MELDAPQRLWDILEESVPVEVAPSSTSIGAISELLAASRLMGLGLAVARPFSDDAGVDLVAYANRRVVTVQVRSSAFHEVLPQHSFHVFPNKKNRWSADFFIFHGRSANGDVWWIVPSFVLREHGAKTSVSLRPGAKGWSSRLAPYQDAWHLIAEALAT